MRILVDDKGWKLVGDASDLTAKRASGVFPKLDPGAESLESGAVALVTSAALATSAASVTSGSSPSELTRERARSDREAELAQARTEPSPPSDAAVAHAGLRMPTAPRLPADFARDAGIAQDPTAFDAGFEAADFESTDESVASGEKASSEDSSSEEARVA